ncbi:unnamed protein product [Oreochromis niloticus]|nr:unnamed protein product [Mustela putorius furo]
MATRSENVIGIVVIADQIIPPINRCFERLSEVQWSMIENGTCDSSVRAVLADMICELIQIASSRILKVALPIIEDCIAREGPEPLYAGKIVPSLGNSISAAIARALNVPKQRHESADELTRMVEEEISEKIRSTIDLITKSPDFPQDPAVYVSGKFSNIEKLNRMVCHAASCLKMYLACKRRCRCASRGSDSGTERTDSKMPVQPAIAEISAILSSSSSDGEMTEKDKDEDKEKHELPQESVLTEQDKIKPSAESQSIRPPTPVEVVAADIVNEILGNMDSSSEELCERCSLPKPAFNAGLIINKVRDFFSKCLPSTSHSKLKARKHRFSVFAKKQFEKMKKELRQVIKTNRKFVVCLQNICKFHKNETVSSDESPQSTQAHRAPSRNTLRYMSSSPVEFDTIRSDINRLFDKLTKKEELLIVHKTLDNFRKSGGIRDFTVDLTGKVFDLLMTDRLYEIPEPLMGRSLSDTVISSTPQPAHGSKRPFSAEVLYVLVEDAVEKFLQKLLLWVENEDKNQMIEDKVSVAVEDIQNFFKRARTPTKEKSTDSDGSGKESVLPFSSSKSGSISPEKSSVVPDQSEIPKSGSISPEKFSVVPDQSPEIPKSGSISPEKSSVMPDQSPEIPKSGSISPEKSSVMPDQSPEIPKSGSISPEKSSVVPDQSPEIPKSGSISPEKSSVVPDQSEIPKSGSIYPEKSSVMPDQSPEIPKSGSISPEKSSVPPDQILQTPSSGSIYPEKSFSDGSDNESILSFSSSESGSISPEKCSLAPDQTTQTPKSGSISPTKCSASVSGSLKDSPDMSEMRSVSVSSSDAEKISSDLAFFLMVRVIKKSKSKTKQSVSLSEELETVINRLRDLIQPELSRTESATSLINNKQKFIKKLAKCLIKEFGSPESVLNAAMANDLSFDEALIKHLKIRLGVIPSPPKKSKFSRFLSVVGKALRKPFRWFTKARDD